MNYETLANENMILYRTLAKLEKMMNDIKMVYKDFNFYDTNYKEMYEKLRKIYDIMEDRKK